MKTYLFTICLLCLYPYFTNAQTITITEQDRPCSLRGLSVVDDHVAWVSGSKGSVGRSTDGGKTWAWQQVKGFEQADFRDIEAFSASDAIIMSSGTPALVLKTANGGANWKVVFRNDDKAYFLDAMDFTSNGSHGYILGDPIDGKFLLLETLDGGDTWQKFKYMPDALPGEAAFAASGTCLQVYKVDGTPMIVTGGTVSRFLKYYDYNQGWLNTNLALTHGKPSQGAFSFTWGPGKIVFTGGDYAQPTKPDSTVSYLRISPMKTKAYLGEAVSYQSCVIYLGKYGYLSTGTAGTNFKSETAISWQKIDADSFNVCQKAKHGSLVLLAGDQGKIAILKN